MTHHHFLGIMSFSQHYLHKPSTKDGTKWEVLQLRIVNKFIYEQWLWAWLSELLLPKIHSFLRYFISCLHGSTEMHLKVNLKVHKGRSSNRQSTACSHRRCRPWTQLPGPPGKLCSHQDWDTLSLSYNQVMWKNLMNSIKVFFFLEFRNLLQCSTV